jgi:hypothetical protein
MKIRYYGWLSSAKRKTTLPAIRGALNAPHLQSAHPKHHPIIHVQCHDDSRPEKAR